MMFRVQRLMLPICIPWNNGTYLNL